MKAFPVEFKWGKELDGYNGMDLRDWFAGLAMQLSFKTLHNPELNDPVQFEGDDEFFHSDLSVVAREAYYLADAMMEARKQ